MYKEVSSFSWYKWKYLNLPQLLFLRCTCSVTSDSVTSWTVAHQALLSMEFSRQEYWSWLPFPNPGDRNWVSCISCMGRQILYHCATNPLVLKLTKNSISFTYKMYPQHNWSLLTPLFLSCQSSLYQFSCFSLCPLHVQSKSPTILFKYKWKCMTFPLCTFLNHSENTCLIIHGSITQSLKVYVLFHI